MESSGKNSCLYQGRAYSDGSEVCSEQYCIVCRSGDWKERDESFWDSFGSSQL
jgi:hypothetical protein